MKPTWKWWVTRRAASLTYLAASDAKRWRSKAVWSLKGRSCRKMPIKFQQPIKVRTIVPTRQRARNLMHRRLGSVRRTFLSLIHNLNTRLKSFHNFYRFNIKWCGDSLHPSRDLSFQQIVGANEIMVWILEGSNKYDILFGNWNSYFSNWDICVSVFLFVCLFVICLRRGATACNTSSWDFDPEPLLLICLSGRQKHTTKQFEKGVVLENNPSCTFRLLILFGWIQLHHRECLILNSRAGYILVFLRSFKLGRLFLNKHKKEVLLGGLREVWLTSKVNYSPGSFTINR